MDETKRLSDFTSGSEFRNWTQLNGLLMQHYVPLCDADLSCTILQKLLAMLMQKLLSLQTFLLAALKNEDSASILLQFLLELTLWKPSWKKAVPDLLINQHTAVHHPRYLCFLQKTNWLNMQVPTHIWTGLTRCIMKFYLSNLIKAVWDSNNTKERGISQPQFPFPFL